MKIAFSNFLSLSLRIPRKMTFVSSVDPVWSDPVDWASSRRHVSDASNASVALHVMHCLTELSKKKEKKKKRAPKTTQLLSPLSRSCGLNGLNCCPHFFISLLMLLSIPFCVSCFVWSERGTWLHPKSPKGSRESTNSSCICFFGKTKKWLTYTAWKRKDAEGTKKTSGTLAHWEWTPVLGADVTQLMVPKNKRTLGSTYYSNWVFFVASFLFAFHSSPHRRYVHPSTKLCAVFSG